MLCYYLIADSERFVNIYDIFSRYSDKLTFNLSNLMLNIVNVS